MELIRFCVDEVEYEIDKSDEVLKAADIAQSHTIVDQDA